MQLKFVGIGTEFVRRFHIWILLRLIIDQTTVDVTSHSFEGMVNRQRATRLPRGVYWQNRRYSFDSCYAMLYVEFREWRV